MSASFPGHRKRSSLYANKCLSLQVFTKSWDSKHPVVHSYFMCIRNDKDEHFR